jgi:hypothetical protein
MSVFTYSNSGCFPGETTPNYMISAYAACMSPGQSQLTPAAELQASLDALRSQGHIVLNLDDKVQCAGFVAMRDMGIAIRREAAAQLPSR